MTQARKLARDMARAKSKKTVKTTSLFYQEFERIWRNLNGHWKHFNGSAKKRRNG